jgi:hypothetical protein
MWDMPDENFKPVDLHGARLSLRESLDSTSQPRPGLDLVLKQYFDFVDH